MPEILLIPLCNISVFSISHSEIQSNVFWKWDILVYVVFYYLSFQNFPFYAVQTTTCSKKV